MRQATILYMTGTGNTRRAAEIIVEALQAAGWGAHAQELRKSADLPRRQVEEDLLVIAFPVLGFGMPALVHSLLRSLRGRRKKPDGNRPTPQASMEAVLPGVQPLHQSLPEERHPVLAGPHGRPYHHKHCTLLGAGYWAEQAFGRRGAPAAASSSAGNDRHLSPALRAGA